MLLAYPGHILQPHCLVRSCESPNFTPVQGLCTPLKTIHLGSGTASRKAPLGPSFLFLPACTPVFWYAPATPKLPQRGADFSACELQKLPFEAAATRVARREEKLLSCLHFQHSALNCLKIHPLRISLSIYFGSVYVLFVARTVTSTLTVSLGIRSANAVSNRQELSPSHPNLAHPLLLYHSERFFRITYHNL